MRDKIEKLYHKLKNKNEFLRKAETEFGKSYNTMKNHWFSGGFAIPEEYQNRAFELLKTTVKKQNAKLV